MIYLVCVQVRRKVGTVLDEGQLLVKQVAFLLQLLKCKNTLNMRTTVIEAVAVAQAVEHRISVSAGQV